MSNKPKQKSLIEKKDWDCLVVLDACRYDYFQEVYEDYLNGTLNKVISEGYNTDTWVVNTFSDYDFDDVIYISANARINGKGVRVIENFDPDWFFKIKDVWDDETNYKITPPELVGRITRKVKLKHPKKRIISHFTQPHSPFTSLGQDERSQTDRIRNFVGKMVTSLIGHNKTRKVREFLGIINRDIKGLEHLIKKYGLDKVKKAYEADLRIAFEEVQTIAKRIPGKIIVTSDHAELLGERGKYGHSNHDSFLKRVPWLEVEDVKI